MDLETYKQKVRECLLTEQNCTEQYADELMEDYIDVFPEYFTLNLSPAEMASAMTMGY